MHVFDEKKLNFIFLISLFSGIVQGHVAWMVLKRPLKSLELRINHFIIDSSDRIPPSRPNEHLCDRFEVSHFLLSV